MNRKLTHITPVIDGYAVVVAQEPSEGGKPGKYLGCFLQTPENPDHGPYMLLTEAMGAYMHLTSKTKSNDDVAIDAEPITIRRLSYL